MCTDLKSKIVNCILFLLAFILLIVIISEQIMIVDRYNVLGSVAKILPQAQGILVVDEDNQEIFLDSKDSGVGKYVVQQGSWEPHLRNVMKQIVSPGNKVIVLGGHVGVHAMLLSRLVGQTGHLDVFEPNPATLKFLKANIFFNPIKNITLYEKAAFSKNEELKFVALSRTNNSGGSHLVREQDNGVGEEITVSAIKLDDVLEIPEGGFDIIQMDVEGAEAQAIFGAQNIIDHSPNLVVLQEWTPAWMSGDYIEQYFKFWHDRGYKFAKITADKLVEMSDDELRQAPQIDLIITKNLDRIIKTFKPLQH
jgi:FkbM family methyltransferase